jgi:DNA repair protein RadA/Sms
VTARETTVYRCQECGYPGHKPGTCPDCARTGVYTQLVEEKVAPLRGSRRPAHTAGGPVALKDVAVEAGDRVLTRIAELDRVLGGGVVRGSLVLIGGDPGIGKSTLLLQAARALAEVTPPVLYVTAEESAAQVSCARSASGSARAVCSCGRRRISRWYRPSWTRSSHARS